MIIGIIKPWLSSREYHSKLARTFCVKCLIFCNQLLILRNHLRILRLQFLMRVFEFRMRNLERRMLLMDGVLHNQSNDPSSATAATRRVDCNSSVMPPFAAAHG